MSKSDNILKLASMRIGDFSDDSEFYEAKDRFESFLRMIIARARETSYIKAANWVMDRLDDSPVVAPINNDIAEKLGQASAVYGIPIP